MVQGIPMLWFILMICVHRVSLFDYQAMCKNSHHHANAARSLPNVSSIHTYVMVAFPCLTVFPRTALLWCCSADTMVLLQHAHVSFHIVNMLYIKQTQLISPSVTVLLSSVRFLMDLNLCGLWHEFFVEGRKPVRKQLDRSWFCCFQLMKFINFHNYILTQEHASLFIMIRSSTVKSVRAD